MGDCEDGEAEPVNFLEPIIPSDGWQQLGGLEGVLDVVVGNVEVDGDGVILLLLGSSLKLRGWWWRMQRREEGGVILRLREDMEERRRGAQGRGVGGVSVNIY